MRQDTTAAFSLIAIGLLGIGSSAAQTCAVNATDAYEMSEAEVRSLYSCIEAEMVAGYSAGVNPVANAYRGWTATGTRPGPDPSHGDRLLLTFANDIAAEQYLKFATDGVEIPTGGILAKESISVVEGEARVGPLFVMEKVGAEIAPDTGGWTYSAVQPDGKMMGVPQGFCHNCHVAFEGQDSLAYPAADLRVVNEP